MFVFGLEKEIFQIFYCLFVHLSFVTSHNLLFFTADPPQPWIDYVNTQNEYLIIEAVVCFDYSNIHYLYFIIQYVHNCV